MSLALVVLGQGANPKALTVPSGRSRPGSQPRQNPVGTYMPGATTGGQPGCGSPTGLIPSSGIHVPPQPCSAEEGANSSQTEFLNGAEAAQ